MEILDVVDEQDQVIGRATRDECHVDPTKIHRTSHFTLFDRKSGKILLTQRAFSKKSDPGKMCFLGEHVHAGETYEEAVQRGVVEELGFTPNIITPKAKNLFHFSTQTEFGQFFLVDWEGQEIKFASEELETVLWLSPEEILRQNLDYSDTAKYWIETIFRNKLP